MERLGRLDALLLLLACGAELVRAPILVQAVVQNHRGDLVLSHRRAVTRGGEGDGLERLAARTEEHQIHLATVVAATGGFDASDDQLREVHARAPCLGQEMKQCL